MGVVDTLECVHSATLGCSRMDTLLWRSGSIDRKGLSLNRIGMSGMLGVWDVSTFLFLLYISIMATFVSNCKNGTISHVAINILVDLSCGTGVPVSTTDPIDYNYISLCPFLFCGFILSGLVDTYAL